MKRFFPLLLLLLAWTSACRSAPAAAATPYPQGYLPTLIALTAQSIPAAAGTTPSPVPTQPASPTPLPAVDLTAVFAALTPSPTAPPPREAIQIHFPGMLSKTISPISVRAHVIPGARGVIRIELLGQDGRLLTRKLLRYTESVYPQIYVLTDLTFEIPEEAELGRLQILTEDEYGRPLAQNSVHVLLLNLGENEIVPNIGPPIRLSLDEPRPDSVATGGVVHVRGTFHPFNTAQPLILEVMDRQGKTLGSRLLAISAPDTMSFESDIPCSVDSATSVRLIIRQSDDRIPGTIYLFSETLVVTP